MTAKAYNRMLKKMRQYISHGKTFDRFRNDHLGYKIAWSTMLKAWKMAEVQILGQARNHDVIITPKLR